MISQSSTAFSSTRDSLVMGLANIRYRALKALNLIRCGKPRAIRLTVSRIWSDRICCATWARSNSMRESCSLGRMQRTKWGLAWTRVRSRLSNLVWKSCVSVETGSSPLRSWFSGLDDAEVGEILKLIPRGLWGRSMEAGCEVRALISFPKRCVANPNWQLSRLKTETTSSGMTSRFVSRKSDVS